jgi:hypothetical protein
MKITKKYLQKLIEEEAKAVLEEGTASWIGAEIFGASEDEDARKACMKVTKALDASHRRLGIALKGIGRIEELLAAKGLIHEKKRWSYKDPFGTKRRQAAMAKLDGGIKEHNRDWALLFDKIRTLQEKLDK